MSINASKTLLDYIYNRFRYNKDCLQVDTFFDSDPPGFRLRIYTDRHRYNIVAHDAPNDNDGPSYLGCTASCRAPYPGEDHVRGDDLPDGELTMETWCDIMEAIVRYETLPIFKPKGESIIDGQ